MNQEFEVQLRESLYNVNRRRSRWESYPVSTLSLAIVVLGFISVAIGYTINGIPRETLVRVFGGNSVAIETPVRAESAAETLSELPRALARLLFG